MTQLPADHDETEIIGMFEAFGLTLTMDEVVLTEETVESLLLLRDSWEDPGKLTKTIVDRCVAVVIDTGQPRPGSVPGQTIIIDLGGQMAGVRAIFSEHPISQPG